jgi:hypothetical protein
MKCPFLIEYTFRLILSYHRVSKLYISYCTFLHYRMFRFAEVFKVYSYVRCLVPCHWLCYISVVFLVSVCLHCVLLMVPCLVWVGMYHMHSCGTLFQLTAS